MSRDDRRQSDSWYAGAITPRWIKQEVGPEDLPHQGGGGSIYAGWNDDVNGKVNGKHHPKGTQEDRTQTSCKETEGGTRLDQSTEAMERWETYQRGSA